MIKKLKKYSLLAFCAMIAGGYIISVQAPFSHTESAIHLMADEGGSDDGNDGNDDNNGNNNNNDNKNNGDNNQGSSIFGNGEGDGPHYTDDNGTITIDDDETPL